MSFKVHKLFVKDLTLFNTQINGKALRSDSKAFCLVRYVEESVKANEGKERTGVALAFISSRLLKNSGIL